MRLVSDKKEIGSASVELVAAVPIVVLFILIAFQLAQVFSHAALGVADANAAAETALRAWEEGNAGAGLMRPCIENMENTLFGSPATQFRIGMGSLSKTIDTRQEVRVVQDPICAP